MAATGDPQGDPVRWPVAIADLSTGLWAATAILTALYARERSGRGQFIDQSLLEGQLSWAPVMAAQCLASGQPPARLGNRHPNIVPYEIFKARDKHLVVAVGTEGHWRRFCDALGLGEAVRDDPRFATNADRLRNRGALGDLLQATFGREDAAPWLARLRAADIPCGPVNRLDETLGDPQVLHRGMVVEFDHPMGEVRLLGTPVHLSDTPVSYRRRPPFLGEHTDEVLRQAGAHLRSVALGRPPRHDATLRARLVHRGRTVSATTLNVSEGGCAVKVRGLRPKVGDEVALHVTSGALRVKVQALVRWSAPRGGRERTVGMQVLPGAGDRGWPSLVAALIRPGAGAPDAAEACGERPRAGTTRR